MNLWKKCKVENQLKLLVIGFLSSRIIREHGRDAQLKLLVIGFICSHLVNKCNFDVNL